MGASFRSVAVRNGTRDTVLAAMGLRGTGHFEEVPESDITGAALPSGWYMITANRCRPDVMGDAVLQRLSNASDVVTWFVEEHVMCSSAAFWAGARQVWSVAHDAQRGMEHLETQGSLPPSFAPIRERLQAEQAAAGGEDAEVDHLFDIPVEMIAQLTGYRHDKVLPDLGDRAFEVLAGTAAPPKRSLLQRWFGI